MNIIHGMNDRTLPRLMVPSLADRLGVMPAVVVTGARQTGKSTLAQELTPGTRRFLTLDDLDVLDAARRDPTALVGGAQPVTLDEVQREPDLLHAVKRAIDRQRRPGQFLLTGSANLLLMEKVSESLAGRASYLTLWPLTRREQLGTGVRRRLGAAIRHPRRALAGAIGRPAGAAGEVASAGSPRGISCTRRPTSNGARAGNLVRRLYPHLPGARPAGPLGDLGTARFSPTNAGRVPPARPTRQPDRAWP